MSMTDSLGDMLTRIRNGNAINKTFVDAPFSAFKKKVLAVLKDEQYIRDFEEIEEGGRKQLRIHLLYYQNKKRAITMITRSSKPGRRLYVAKDDIPVVKNNLGTAVLTTPSGVMSGRKAKETGVGGELLFTIW